jgi:hypothetical protein
MLLRCGDLIYNEGFQIQYFNVVIVFLVNNPQMKQLKVFIKIMMSCGITLYSISCNSNEILIVDCLDDLFFGTQG